MKVTAFLISFLLSTVHGLFVLKPRICNSKVRLYDTQRRYPLGGGGRRENTTHVQEEPKRYPIGGRGQNTYENYLKRLNSKNHVESEEAMFNDIYDEMFGITRKMGETNTNNGSETNVNIRDVRIFINSGNNPFNNMGEEEESEDDEDDNESSNYESFKKKQDRKSKHFEVVGKSPFTFKDVGGYDSVKAELDQCIDLLKNHTKYAGYNVRVPRGLIFEGPPGNGKTLLAKALAGESRTSFIAVSGSEFQEKYVGVGSSKIRELFELAKKNIPCIIFIDEIDAVGRKRSGDGESAGSERDSTLNELLVAMDGFKNRTGVFIVAATNRADMLDPALIRPGRIDKRIFIGNPDTKTRDAIIKIHIRGKPHDKTISIEDLVEQTNGLSGAQMENLLNEAMLNALKNNEKTFGQKDIDLVMNKIIAGYQATPMEFTEELVYRVCVHEAGHSIVGILSKSHAKMKKVVINLTSPRSPGYTIFETKNEAMYTREDLFEHLVILIAGHIAERVIFNESMTTGASDDIKKSIELATNMANMYGMSSRAIYPNESEKYKTIIDDEIFALLNEAYAQAEYILVHSKELIIETAKLLQSTRSITSDTLSELIRSKYPSVLKLTKP